MIAPARRVALDALRQIDGGRVSLGEAVADSYKSLPDERDRGLLLELVSGTERMRAALDYQIAARSKRPLAKLDEVVLTILRLSAFQLLYLSRLPASAIINDAVDLTKRSGKTSATGLVNAILRALSRDRETLTWPDRANLAAYLATYYSHPEWLVARWIERYGADQAERWLDFNNHAAALCLAPNRLLASREALAEELASDGVVTEPTLAAPYGLRVISGHPIATRAFREGRCLVQDEASQLINGVANVAAGNRVLDLCASPGGKTVALAADVGKTGLVVACDLRAHRLRVLLATLTRCRAAGVPIVRVPADGPLPFLDDSFDAVLIDAPCSGLGTLRRDPDIRWRRRPADLARFAVTQLDLLTRVSGLVRAGGSITYSTCSSEPEENDAVIAAFLATHPEYQEQRRHQTLPFRDHLEAFFAAVLVRRPL
ncbi:MAG: 16S rRNA (cytosine(967)-C(5))-methyltransferase RsmB [Vicinamibacterales bacterium]